MTFWRTVLSLTATFSAASGAFAQAWPSKPIELVHGFGTGGQADIVARVVGERLTERLKTPVVVNAKAGAGGILASEAVARAAPDGYTLILLTGGHAVSAVMYKSLKFDPVKSFSFIGQISVNPFVFVVRKDSPITDVPSLIASAKREPDTLTVSSVGVGSTQHLVGELFGISAGVKLRHVPYRGGGAPMTDLLGGSIDMTIDSIAATRAAVESGRARVIAVTTARKWPTLPDVPTVATTLPGFEVGSWLGLAAPSGTPAAIIQRLNSELNSILAEKALSQKLLELGSEVKSGTPDDFKNVVSSEINRWNEVISKSGIEKY